MLRPLTPLAPGTQRYRVTFAEWFDDDDAYVRRDVHVMHVWAIDASGARRLAQEDVQRVPNYRAPWRIREVVRVPPPVYARCGASPARTTGSARCRPTLSCGTAWPVVMSCVRMPRRDGNVRVPQRSHGGGVAGAVSVSVMPRP